MSKPSRSSQDQQEHHDATRDVWTIVISATGFAAALVLMLAYHSNTPVEAGRASAGPKPVVAHEAATAKIAPADVLGTGVISWAPRTGDGSN